MIRIVQITFDSWTAWMRKTKDIATVARYAITKVFFLGSLLINLVSTMVTKTSVAPNTKLSTP